MKRAFAILFIVVLAATLSGCLGALGQWLQGPETITGRWKGTLNITSKGGAPASDSWDMTIILAELSTGDIIGSVVYEQVDPTSGVEEYVGALEGVRTGDNVRLLLGVYEPGIVLEGNVSGNSMQGTAATSQAVDPYLTGTWQVTRVE
ncbi:hypothetical protein KAH43_06700 [Candidatus Bipolaricaulota bacterium]|nr:hypothetical protein [Candidatus Bipolaricaulota bacterium]